MHRGPGGDPDDQGLADRHLHPEVEDRIAPEDLDRTARWGEGGKERNRDGGEEWQEKAGEAMWREGK